MAFPVEQTDPEQTDPEQTDPEQTECGHEYSVLMNASHDVIISKGHLELKPIGVLVMLHTVKVILHIISI